MPTTVGGIGVHTGEIVPGDCDGVVVVPREYKDFVFTDAIAKFEKEEHILQELLTGKTTLEVYGFDKRIEKKLRG